MASVASRSNASQPDAPCSDHGSLASPCSSRSSSATSRSSSATSRPAATPESVAPPVVAKTFSPELEPQRRPLGQQGRRASAPDVIRASRAGATTDDGTSTEPLLWRRSVTKTVEVPTAMQTSPSEVTSRARGRRDPADEEHDDFDWEAMTAGEWAARLMCTSASERRESCVNLVSRLEAMLPSCILESLVKVKIADMLESEFEAKLQAISHQSFNLVKNDVAELKALRVEKEEFENRMMLMNSTYLREITSKRDLTRTDSCAVIEMLSKEGHVGGDVQFYEPLQHLSDEVRQCVMSILDEKLKAIFEWSPEMKEKTSKFELAKFEDGLLRERLASYTVLNGQLREELRELRQRAKQAEIGSQRSEWEQQKAESQSSMLKRQLEAAQKELESISRQYDEVCRDAQSLRERLARAAQIEVAGAREQGDGGEGPEAPAPGAKEEGKEEDDQQKKRPQPAAPKQMVACGVQTDATQTDATRTPTPAVSREGTKEKELTPLTPPAGKPSPRQRRRSHSEVLMLSEAADLGDPIEKRLYQAERQAELSTKLLHQRDELIQSLQSRVESLQNTVEGLQAAADGGAAGPSLGGPTRGAPPDDGAAWERTVSFASDRSASDRSAADRSTAPPASPTEGDAAAMGARGGGRAPARAAEAGRGSGVEGEGAAGGAEPPEEGPVGAAREARERADFVSSMADSLREELQAAREELAAAEERLRALTSSERDDSPGLVQLEAESRARKAACDELEASKAALGLAQSRIKVLEAALGAQDFVSDAFAEEDEEEPDEDQQPVPTELGNAASRATAAEEFKSRSILLDQKKVLRDKVKVQKAQLSAIFHENTTLHLALNEVQKEMYSLTSKLRKRIPDSQQGTVDVESVLKRMEKVAASGIGGYIRLHKQAHLKEVAAAAVCGAARGADSPRAPADAARAAREAAGAGASGSPAPPADGGGGEPQRDGRAPAAAPTVGSPRSRRLSDEADDSAPRVLAAVSFTQFGATEVPMARAALAAPSGSSSACVRAHALKVAQDRHRAQDYPRSDREPSATALAPGPAFQPLIVAAPGGAASATPRRHGARYASVTPRARVNSDAGATISCPPARQAAHRLQLQSPERAGHEEPQEAPEELGGLPSLAPRGAAISRHTSPTGRLPVLGTAGRAATLSEEASLHRRLKFASTQPEIPMPGRLMPLWPG